MLACRLCLINIKVLLSESAVSCLLRVRSVSFTSLAKECTKFVPHSRLVSLSHKVGVFLEDVLCYFIYAKFAVMLRLSINTVVANHVNSDRVPIFLLNVGIVPTVWHIFFHFIIHFRIWQKTSWVAIVKIKIWLWSSSLIKIVKMKYNRIDMKWWLVSTSFKIYIEILSDLYITFTIFYYNTILLKWTWAVVVVW